MRIKTIVVEDEPLARQRLRELLSQHSDIEIVAEAADGRSAVRSIDTLKPDLVCLDIQIPELDGLGVLREISHRPVIVFTTAHDRYAVTAFELCALDYLVKPFGADRLALALARARERLKQGGRHDVDAACHALANTRKLDRLFVRHGGKIIPLGVKEIERLEADGDYVALISRGKRYLVNLPLAEFEANLDATHFVRVHRSHIVNIDFVESLEPEGNAQFLVHLRDGSKIIANRSASKALRDLTL